MFNLFFLFLVVASGTLASADDTRIASDVWKRVVQATVQVEAGGDRSTGVFVSSEGLLLTVAHGVPRNSKVRVRLGEDRTVLASVEYRNDKLDFAVLRAELSEADKDSIAWLPFAESTRGIDSLCLAAGFPARENKNASAVIRAGIVTRKSSQQFSTTCALTVGDSGGPLVTSGGQLLGISQTIGKQRVAMHLRTDVLKAALPSKLRAEIEQAPAGAFRPFPAFKNSALIEGLTVKVVSEKTHATICLGTLVGERFIVTKFSEIAGRMDLKFRHGTTLGSLRIVKTERVNDLALCELQTGLAAQLPGIAKAAAGEFLEANGQSIGIVARSTHHEPAENPHLGFSLETTSAGLQIASVSGPSSLAGLKSKDRLLQFDGKAVQSTHDLVMALKRIQPGDVVALTVNRAGESREYSLRPAEDPAFLLDRRRFLDGFGVPLSRRRTGFLRVLQHDAPVTPQQMGGPLVNRAGELVGLNIARTSRESVLAIPWSVVADFVEHSLRPGEE